MSDAFNRATAIAPIEYQYCVGGTVSTDAPSYIRRTEIGRLYKLLKAGNFCYVFNARQKGKSSVQGGVSERLEEDGWTCALFDLSYVGADSISVEQWYRSLIQHLADELDLDLKISDWWEEQGDLTPLAYLNRFFEDIVLAQIEGHILISIDEIDTVLSLPFPMDDFFAFIRSCNNQRSNKPHYQRLTFLLLGVASPADLIQDKTRTPFNVGKAINLTRFEKTDIQPLATGLKDRVDSPGAVLEEIWEWTNGNPFLMQKICNIIYEGNIQIRTGEEKAQVKEIIETHIITNWEEHDDPQHLKTIVLRITNREPQQANRLLTLYRTIYAQGEIPANDSLEQTELWLSGIVVKESGILRVANRIYREIFNEIWLKKALETFKPYAEALNAWQASKQEDSSRLLHGQALEDALKWVEDNPVRPNSLDEKFLLESKAYARYLFIKEAEGITKNNQIECEEIFNRYSSLLKRHISDDSNIIIQEIGKWTGYNPELFDVLTKVICQDIGTRIILDSEAPEQVAQFCNKNIIQYWEGNSANRHLNNLWRKILQHDRKNDILALYGKILRNEETPINDRPNLLSLLDLGLISIISQNHIKKLVISNEIYRFCFNKDWVDKELTKDLETKFIINRYEVQRNLSEQALITTSLVKDMFEPSEEIYLAKKFSPKKYIQNETLLKRVSTLFFEAVGILGSAGRINQIPTVRATFPDDDEFYIIQDYIPGRTLDNEVKLDQTVDQDKAIQFLIEIQDVLNQAHDVKLKHLNLHPGNILRREDNKLVLIDFAIFPTIAAEVIKIDPSGRVLKVGTDGYTAPEQIEGKPSFQSDIYSVGMIGIQALTGKHPDRLPEDTATGAKIWRYAAPGQAIVEIDERLAVILDQMIHPDCLKRYANVSDALSDLRDLKANRQQEDAERQAQIQQQQETEQQQLVWQQQQQQRLKEQEDSKKAEEAKKTEEEKRKRSIQQRNIVIGGISVGVGLLCFGLWISNLWNQKQYAQYEKVCSQAIAIEDSATTTLLNSQVVELVRRKETACTELIESGRQANSSSFYLNRGRARLIIWKNEKTLNNDKKAEDSLDKAIDDFKQASQSSGQASLLEGMAKSLELSDPNIEQYEPILLTAADQALEHYFTFDGVHSESDEIPFLMKLAFFVAPQDDYSPDNLDKSNRLFALMDEAAKQRPSLPGDSTPDTFDLIYNRAVLETRAGNVREAIALFKQILSKKSQHETLQLEKPSETGDNVNTASDNVNSHPIDQELLDKTHQSLGFTYFKLGLQDDKNIDKALAEFKEMKSSSAIVRKYQEFINDTCGNREEEEQPGCWATLIGTLSKDDSHEAFPLYPVYSCQEDVVLAIAEQALIDRGLEPASTKLCR